MNNLLSLKEFITESIDSKIKISNIKEYIDLDLNLEYKNITIRQLNIDNIYSDLNVYTLNIIECNNIKELIFKYVTDIEIEKCNLLEKIEGEYDTLSISECDNFNSLENCPLVKEELVLDNLVLKNINYNFYLDYCTFTDITILDNKNILEVDNVIINNSDNIINLNWLNSNKIQIFNCKNLVIDKILSIDNIYFLKKAIENNIKIWVDGKIIPIDTMKYKFLELKDNKNYSGHKKLDLF